LGRRHVEAERCVDSRATRYITNFDDVETPPPQGQQDKRSALGQLQVLAAARVVGVTAVLVVTRYRRPPELAYETAVHAAQTVTAILVAHVALGDALGDYHLLAAARADLLRRLDRREEAAEAYERALELATNAAERRFLERRRAQLA
jgi:tetratricopeptide (TPR) repeat protein